MNKTRVIVVIGILFVSCSVISLIGIFGFGVVGNFLGSTYNDESVYSIEYLGLCDSYSDALPKDRLCIVANRSIVSNPIFLTVYDVKTGVDVYHGAFLGHKPIEENVHQIAWVNDDLNELIKIIGTGEKRVHLFTKPTYVATVYFDVESCQLMRFEKQSDSRYYACFSY